MRTRGEPPDGGSGRARISHILVSRNGIAGDDGVAIRLAIDLSVCLTGVIDEEKAVSGIVGVKGEAQESLLTRSPENQTDDV